MDITATEFKNHFGRYLEQVKLEPIVVKKTGRSAAVLISNDEYERLVAIEDAYWGAKAQAAEATGFVGQEDSIQFIKDGFSEA